MSKTKIDKSIPTFSEDRVAWLPYEATVKELSKMVPKERFDASPLLEKIVRQLRLNLRSSYFSVSKTGDGINLMVTKAQSKRIASKQKTYILVVISIAGDKFKILGKQKNSSQERKKLSRETSHRNRRQTKRNLPPARHRQKRIRRMKRANLDKLQDVIYDLPPTLEKNLALGQSGVINEGATKKYIQKVTKKREDAFASTSANVSALNSLGLTTNRPVVISNSTYVSLEGLNANSQQANSRYMWSVAYANEKLTKVSEFFRQFAGDLPEKLETLKKSYETSQINLDLAIDYIIEIDKFKKDFISGFDDYKKYGLDIEGFQEEMNSTRATLQMFSDLGYSAFQGGYYFIRKRSEDKGRLLEKKSSRNAGAYTIQKSRKNLAPRILPYPWLTVNSSFMAPYTYNRGLSWDNAQRQIQRNQLNIEYFDFIANPILDSNNQSSTCTSVELAHRVWTEMLNSYIVTNGTDKTKRNLETAKASGNLFEMFMLDASPSQGGNLLTANQSTGITSLLRNLQRGKTIMPLEKPGIGFEEIGKNGDVFSAVDKWVDPNLGKALEGEDPDFSGLDNWVEKFSDMVNSADTLISPYMKDGHGQLVLNEILRAFRELMVDLQLQHPSDNFHSLLEEASEIDLTRSVDLPDLSWHGANEGDHAAANGKPDRLEGPRAVITALHILKKCHPNNSSVNFIKLLDGTANLATHGSAWPNPATTSWGNESYFSDFVTSIVNLRPSSQATDVSNGPADDQVYQIYLLIIGLITSVCQRVELALSYDVSIHLADKGISPASGEETTTAYTCFNDIFGSTFPVSNNNPAALEEVITTAYSEIPHIYIRGMLLHIMCNLAQDIIGTITTAANQQLDSTSGGYSARPIFLTTFGAPNRFRQKLTEIFLTVVDNVDPTTGPVRWKLTYGEWPNKDIEIEMAGIYEEAIVPSFIRDAVSKGGNFADFDFYSYSGDERSFRELFLTTSTLDPNNSGGQVAAASNPSTAMVTTAVAAVIPPGPLGSLMPSLLELKPIKDATASIFERYYAFLLTKENYVPATYVTSKEIPHVNAITTTLETRGELSWHFKWCVYHRESVRRMFAYLNGLTAKFQTLKSQITAMTENPGGTAFLEIAQIPGVHAPDIIRYSGPRQSVLRKYIQSEELGLEYMGYVASENQVKLQNIKGIKNILSSMVGKTSEKSKKGNPDEGRIVTIGLPSGLIDGNLSLNDVSREKTLFRRLVCINQYTKPLLAGEFAKPINRFYWPCVFITNNNFCRIDFGETITISDILQKLLYVVIDPDDNTVSLLGYEQTAAHLQDHIDEASFSDLGSPPTPDSILINHIYDFCLKHYLKLYSGVKLQESSFPVESKTNDLYIDKALADDYPEIFERLKIEAATFIKEDKFKSFDELIDNLEGSMRDKWNTYTDISATLQSRLFSSNDMISKSLAPNIFDRVFSFYTHIAELRFDAAKYQIINSYLKENMQKDGEFYKIIQGSAVEGNYIFNDNINSSFYSVRTI